MGVDAGREGVRRVACPPADLVHVVAVLHPLRDARVPQVVPPDPETCLGGEAHRRDGWAEHVAVERGLVPVVGLVRTAVGQALVGASRPQRGRGVGVAWVTGEVGLQVGQQVVIQDRDRRLLLSDLGSSTTHPAG